MNREGKPSDELIGEESSSESKSDTTSVVSQHSPERSENYSPQLKLGKQAGLPRTEQRNGGRTDQGRLHAVRDSVLCRGLQETLSRYGENPRTLRRMKADLRTALKPKGPLGNLLFDRFWCCVLRLILVGHLEETGLAPRRTASQNSPLIPSLHEGALPTLVLPAGSGDLTGDHKSLELLDADVLRRLALVSRYDRAAGREMYRTLAFLLLMQDRGEAGLANWARATIGARHENEEGKNA